MKLLISFITILMFLFASVEISNAATTVTTVTTVTKSTATKRAHHKRHCHSHYKKSKKSHKIVHPVTVYYTPAYCESDPCACSGTACYPARYYQCRTDFYYREGRNSARVELCY